MRSKTRKTWEHGERHFMGRVHGGHHSTNRGRKHNKDTGSCVFSQKARRVPDGGNPQEPESWEPLHIRRKHAHWYRVQLHDRRILILWGILQNTRHTNRRWNDSIPWVLWSPLCKCRKEGLCSLRSRLCKVANQTTNDNRRIETQMGWPALTQRQPNRNHWIGNVGPCLP